jgi:predicted Holliday junction resolvase-like endonuclease
MIGRIVTARVVKLVRKEAISSSHKVILWGVYEKILPALPSFPYAPKDMTFLGKWVDYVIFDGLSEGNLREIIFLELKSGKSQLNRNEQQIRTCLAHKKVRFTEYRIGSRKE